LSIHRHFDGKKRTVIDGPFEPYDGGTFEIREVVEFEGM
jgi:hypothetical protein